MLRIVRSWNAKTPGVVQLSMVRVSLCACLYFTPQPVVPVVKLDVLVPAKREASAPWRGTLVFSFETALLALSAKYLQCPQGLTTNHLPENCERIVCRGGFRTRAIVQFYQTGRLQTRLSSPSARARMASGSRAESLSRNKGAPHWNNRTGLRALGFA